MSDDKITCAICGAQTHVMKPHLEKDHPEVSVAEYEAKYPGQPLFSEKALAMLAAKRAEKAAQELKAVQESGGVEPSPVAMTGTGGAVASVTRLMPKDTVTQAPFHEVFGFGPKVVEAMSTKKGPIPISVILDSAHPELVPKVSEDYIYDVDELKNVILALELKIPCYVWGHKGSGKSELYDQIAARTGRPAIRIQHSGNTEESHIIGQWVVKDGNTEFQLGPLPMAMLHGWMYIADEYDFALPSVLSVYQAVLEGKPLFIKEADLANRIIKPHPNFRFCATGNTNGSGDETGLYQGTSLQNSANFDRFGMVVNKQYMKKAFESLILQKRVGLAPEDADKLVDFAGNIREAYDGAKISDVISPRSLIYAAQIGVKRASFKQGIQLAFINKLSRVDREVVGGIAQRIFGA